MIWLTVALAVIFSVPNFFSKEQLAAMPDWLPKRTMPLGLDLQGGSHILLQVERPDLIKDRVNTVRDDVRRLLRDAKIEYSGLGAGIAECARENQRLSQAAPRPRPPCRPAAPANATLLGPGNVIEVDIEEGADGQLDLKLTEQGIEYRIASAATQSIEVDRAARQRTGHDRAADPTPGQ